MWNPIARWTGVTRGDGVVRGVGAETAAKQRVADSLYSRRRLAELCVLVLLVGFALYLFIPSAMGTADSARRAKCFSHLRRLAQAVEMYRSDNEGYPPTATWVPALFDLMTDRDGSAIFFCPSEENMPRPLRKHNWVNSSYSYRNPAPSGVVLDESTTPLIWDYLGGSGAAAHPGGGNVVYVDGHTQWTPHNRWQNSDLP
jgi:prepilin-type processing-associated H-X9-DG protein